VDKEIIFLDLSFIGVERSRLRAFNYLPIDIEISIMAWAYVSGCFLFPVHAAA
jgi:hypothetical protein